MTLLSLSLTVCFGIFNCSATLLVLFQTLVLLFPQCFEELIHAFVEFFVSSDPTHIHSMLLFHMSSVVAVLEGIMMFAPPTASTIVLSALKLAVSNIILVDHDILFAKFDFLLKNIDCILLAGVWHPLSILDHDSLGGAHNG